MPSILITGATGYLGSHLVRACLQDEWEVRILARPESDPWRLVDVMPCIRRFDVRGPDDEATMVAALAAMGPADSVVHCATAYGRKGETEVQVSAANRELPATLLACAVRAGVGHFVNTDTVLPAAANSYAATKAVFRDLARGAAVAGKITVSNLALEHFYGPGDDDTKFPTWVARQCLSNTPELKLTAGTQLRDFLYIDDVIAAYRAVLYAPATPHRWGSWRVKSGQPISIRRFVEMIHDLCDSDTMLNFGAVPSRIEPEAEASFPDFAASNAGWSPEWSIEDGLTSLVICERSRTAR